jgi:RND family efflux transporter MFP subunit
MKPAPIAGAAITALALTLMGGCGNKNATPEAVETNNAVDTIPVKAITLQPRDFTVRGEYYGRVSGVEEARLVCAGGGRVEKLNVAEGAYVKAGQRLGDINADEAVNAYETAKLNEKIASDNHERLKAHLADGNASQLAVDQARLNWLNAKSALLKAATVRRGALCITPISGTVINRHVELYQELPPGSPTFTIAKLHTMKIGIGIPEHDIADVTIGNEAEVRFDLFPDRVWKAKLVRLAREISPQNRTFTAELHVGNKDGDLVSGLTAYVNLNLRSLSDQVVVPADAIRSEKKESFVMTVKNGRARYRAVELGPTNETHTVILSGLDAGERLIVGGQHLVSNGTPVTIMQ